MADDNLLNVLLGVLQGSQRGAEMALSDVISRRNRREDMALVEQSAIRRAQSQSDIEMQQKRALLPEEEASQIRINAARPQPTYVIGPSAGTVLKPGERPFNPPVLRQSEEEKLSARNMAKKEASMPKTLKSLEDSIAGLDEIESNVDKLLTDKDLWKGTGYGAYLSAFPATKARQIEATIKTIKSATSLNALQEMRLNSPTGGALGNVSDAEGARLENKRATLDSKLSTKDLKDKLLDLKTSLNDSKKRLRRGYELDFGGVESGLPTMGNNNGSQTVYGGTSEVERKTGDGRIAVFDASTKKFLRYK